MVTGVLVGILGLAEALPQTAGAALTRLLSWGCILLGVTGEWGMCMWVSGGCMCCYGGLCGGWLEGWRVGGGLCPAGERLNALGAQLASRKATADGAAMAANDLPACLPALCCSAGQRRGRHAGADGGAAGKAAGQRVESAAREVRTHPHTR